MAVLAYSEDDVVDSMSGFRRYLLLYISHRKVALLLHGLFYLGLIFFFAGIDTYSLDPQELVIDEAGHSMQAFFALPLGYFVLTLLIRDWAAGFEPAGEAARRRLRWVLLGWPRRLNDLGPPVLYYIAAALSPIWLFLPFEDHQHGGLSLGAPLQFLDELFWVALPTVLILVCSRRWAINLDISAQALPLSAPSSIGNLWRSLVLEKVPDLEIWVIRRVIAFSMVLLVLATRESGERLLRTTFVGFMLVSVAGWASSLPTRPSRYGTMDSQFTPER